MANTVAVITFTGVPAVNDYIQLWAHQKVPPFAQFTRGESFVTSRGFPGEVTIGTTAEESASNYATAFTTDYGSDFIVSVTDNVVTITIASAGNFDYFAGSETLGPFTVDVLSPEILVEGLENDRYLINNEIWIQVRSNSTGEPYIITIENLTNQRISSPVKIYPMQNGSSVLEISKYIKSLFDYPADAEGYVTPDQHTQNANNIKFTFSVGEQSVELTKTFIRGGNRTNDLNQFLSVGDIARPTDRIPIWQGYPTADYYVHSSGEIRKRLLASTPDGLKDYRRKKGCNEMYVKFLNQKGGYCHWLFESHSENHSAKPLGSFVRDFQLQSFGVTSDSKMKLLGKFPEYYKGYIDDLIDSAEVWVWKDSNFVRVLAGANVFDFDKVKRAYSVSLNIDFDYRYNPSILW